MPKAGDLVMVTSSYNTMPEVKAHGALWIIDEADVRVKDSVLYMCTSVATGRKYAWYDFELEGE